MDKEQAIKRAESRAVSTVITGIIAVAVVFAAVGFAVNMQLHQPTVEPYAGGKLIDAGHMIVYEEEGDCYELGRRIVRLAAGEEFTEAQIEQLAELMAELVASVRENSMGVEEHEWWLDRLEAKWYNAN